MKSNGKPSTPRQGKPSRTEETGFHEPYLAFARALRTWFVAYGIGAPVLFLSNDNAWARFVAAPNARGVAYLFLAGVALQILSAIGYKTVMWLLYVGELESSFKATRRYRAADRISEAYTPEFIIDLATLACFGVATWLAMEILI